MWSCTTSTFVRASWGSKFEVERVKGVKIRHSNRHALSATPAQCHCELDAPGALGSGSAVGLGSPPRDSERKGCRKDTPLTLTNAYRRAVL